MLRSSTCIKSFENRASLYSISYLVFLFRGRTNEDLGEPIDIITIGTEKKGKVAACSQPLHTNREWLPDWVDYYLSIGVSKLYMHAPQVSYLLDNPSIGLIGHKTDVSCAAVLVVYFVKILHPSFRLESMFSLLSRHSLELAKPDNPFMPLYQYF